MFAKRIAITDRELAHPRSTANLFDLPVSCQYGMYPLAGPGFGAHICDVSVDKETGHVTIERYTAIQDVGKAIHPSYVEGQIQGGAAQGIGWALNEEY